MTSVQGGIILDEEMTGRRREPAGFLESGRGYRQPPGNSSSKGSLDRQVPGRALPRLQFQ
jgi:hypothetical protein